MQLKVVLWTLTTDEGLEDCFYKLYMATDWAAVSTCMIRYIMFLFILNVVIYMSAKIGSSTPHSPGG